MIVSSKGNGGASTTQLSSGVVFNLEEMAFSGRKMLYNAVEKVLTQKKIEFTRSLFCRCFLDFPLGAAVGMLAAVVGKKISADKLLVDVKKQYCELMLQSSTVPVPSFRAILDEAVKNELLIGSFSLFSDEVSSVLFEKLGLNDSIILISAKEFTGALPTRDCWLNLASRVKLHPRRCLALCDSAASCRSSLAAHMRCVAMPGELTGFQDFTGVDLITDDVGSIKPKKMFDLVSLSPEMAVRS